MVAHDAPKDSRSDSVPFAGKIANGLRATLTERLGRTPAPITILRVGDHPLGIEAPSAETLPAAFSRDSANPTLANHRQPAAYPFFHLLQIS
jgi:hypothetical protein